MRLYLILLIVSMVSLAEELPKKGKLMALQYSGVELKLEDGKSWYVERIEPDACMNIAITPDNLYGPGEANISTKCKHTVLTTVGMIQPMSLDPKITTVGELEVLAFMKKMQKDPDHTLLVDSRRAVWYQSGTIPGAVNIPYDEIAYDSEFPDEHARVLRLLNIRKTKCGYDFGKAKKVLLFCNGAWCAQSPRAIRQLVKMGYPKAKILWYRGGLQDWLAMGFKPFVPSQSH